VLWWEPYTAVPCTFGVGCCGGNHILQYLVPLHLYTKNGTSIWPDSEHAKLLDHPKTKNLGGGSGGAGGAQTNKQLLQSLFLVYFYLLVQDEEILHCFLISMSLNLLRTIQTEDLRFCIGIYLLSNFCHKYLNHCHLFNSKSFFVPCPYVMRLSPLADLSTVRPKPINVIHQCPIPVVSGPLPTPPPPNPCCPHPNPCQLSLSSAHENNHPVMLLPCGHQYATNTICYVAHIMKP
jgi:hypothetical protein